MLGRVLKSDKFPKMEVSLYDAPIKPRHIIAYSYLECIEDRKLNSPKEIDDKEATKITEWVLKGGHTPSLEAIYLLFNIRGISRILSHQIVRHRIGVSIDQRTQRANSKEYLGKFETCRHYILPPSIRQIMMDSREFREHVTSLMTFSEEMYNRLIGAGISEDEARYIMPHCAETSMNFKIIYKAFMGAASTRLCHMMQGEMVECFRLMHMALIDYDELLGQYVKPICMITGKCNRNENNPTDDQPKGACIYTNNGAVPVRERDDTFDLTKYSKDASDDK